MNEYIYGAQDDIHIIDLRKTVFLLNNALSFIESIVKNNGLILFIGTKSQASDIVKKYANNFETNPVKKSSGSGPTKKMRI